MSAPDAAIAERGSITFGPSAGVRFAPVKADRVIADGDSVSLGGVTLTAHVTPGHTPGCTSWTMPVVEGGATHKIVFYCSTSIAGNPLVKNTEYPAIAADYRASFAKLKTLKADVFLAPHASFYDPFGKNARRAPGAPNPFIDPGEFPAFVARSQANFEAEFAKQSASKP